MTIQILEQAAAASRQAPIQFSSRISLPAECTVKSAAVRHSYLDFGISQLHGSAPHHRHLDALCHCRHTSRGGDILQRHFGRFQQSRGRDVAKQQFALIL